MHLISNFYAVNVDRFDFMLKSELYVHDLSTGDRTAQFPLDIGSIVGYSGKKKDTEVYTTEIINTCKQTIV